VSGEDDSEVNNQSSQEERMKGQSIKEKAAGTSGG
jgi:hypothetical protein